MRCLVCDGAKKYCRGPIINCTNKCGHVGAVGGRCPIAKPQFETNQPSFPADNS